MSKKQSPQNRAVNAKVAHSKTHLDMSQGILLSDIVYFLKSRR